MTQTETPGAVALNVVRLAREGSFAVVFGRLARPLQALTTPQALQAAWDAETGRHGAVTSVGEPIIESAHPGVVIVKVPVVCERGGMTVVVSVAAGGAVAGIQLAPPDRATPTPPWEPPAYADPSAFTERELTLGSGPLAVPGTLTTPISPGPHPAVVLLAGSGPLDRDETIGANKPLKDLAWGLATQGIVVARFDKVTFAHPAEVSQIAGFTLADEYLPAALTAIEALRAEPVVDPDRVFLAGHSLGGTAAPRVAAAAGDSVAGLVLLAAGAEPLHRAMLRQVRYLASLDPATAATTEPALATLERQADLIDSDQLSAATPPADLPLGTPAAYWLDLRDYDPAQLAATLHKPLLILQGGRDYQSTVGDDLARWQASLEGRPEITIRVYPKHNHLFTPGNGPSTPAEYEPAQHVDQAVIDDIANWMTRP